MHSHNDYSEPSVVCGQHYYPIGWSPSFSPRIWKSWIEKSSLPEHWTTKNNSPHYHLNKSLWIRPDNARKPWLTFGLTREIHLKQGDTNADTLLRLPNLKITPYTKIHLLFCICRKVKPADVKIFTWYPVWLYNYQSQITKAYNMEAGKMKRQICSYVQQLRTYAGQRDIFVALYNLYIK